MLINRVEIVVLTCNIYQETVKHRLIVATRQQVFRRFDSGSTLKITLSGSGQETVGASTKGRGQRQTLHFAPDGALYVHKEEISRVLSDA